MIETETSEHPAIVNTGRIISQVEAGMSCNAFQAVQRLSITPQWPLSVCAASETKKANAKLMTPVRPVAITPTARHLLGILSHASTAHRANALHIPIE